MDGLLKVQHEPSLGFKFSLELDKVWVMSLVYAWRYQKVWVM